jgi:hypothetical protein
MKTYEYGGGGGVNGTRSMEPRPRYHPHPHPLDRPRADLYGVEEKLFLFKEIQTRMSSRSYPGENKPTVTASVV